MYEYFSNRGILRCFFLGEEQGIMNKYLFTTKLDFFKFFVGQETPLYSASHFSYLCKQNTEQNRQSFAQHV